MTLPASQTTVSNRVPPVQPKAVHSEYPCYAYYQAARDVPAKIVKSEAEADALGSEWGPFPWTAEKIDRTHAPDPEGGRPFDEPQGTEYPAMRYHQLSPRIPPRVVNDPSDDAALGSAWGPLPYSEERYQAIQRLQALEKRQAEETAKAAAEAAAEAQLLADEQTAKDAQAKAAAAQQEADAAKAKADADAKSAADAAAKLEADKAPALAPPIKVAAKAK